MNINYYSNQIKNAVDQNPKCITGILVTNRVFVREEGKAGKQEVLCLLYADLYDCYIWGHVFFHEGLDHYVSCLVDFESLISGRTVDHLFDRFDWYIRQKGNWQPVTIQEEWNAFAMSNNFADACSALVRMIGAFDFTKRSPFEDDEANNDPSEYRILNVYPFPSCDRDNWEKPPY